jgi:hypothetical protein
MEHLRQWLADTNSSSQLLMETLAKARGLNERSSSNSSSARSMKITATAMRREPAAKRLFPGPGEAVAALRQFEEQIAQNIQEDQRIIVVDAEGFVLGLVVDHVHEVLNVPKSLMEPPPRITSSGGMELSGVAKLDDGARLIMLLDVASLMKDQKLRDVRNSSASDRRNAEDPARSTKPAPARRN